MPDVYGPFDGATWSQAGWFRDAWARTRSGVFGAAFGTPTTGDLALTVSGLTISMGLGRAHVRGAGYERTGTAWSYDVPANTATSPRVDRLVLRRSLAAQTVVPAVLQGTPAATPTAPAVTQADDGVWELPLFRWTTPANSGAPLTGVIDDRLPTPTSGSGLYQVPRQLDAANDTLTGVTVQMGTGLIVGNGTAEIAETVTFPSAFAAVPVVFANMVGFRNTAAFNPAGLSSWAGVYANAGSTSTTQTTVRMRRTDGGTLATTADYYYTWLALGVLA
jgi:hypothetical protein